MFLLMMSLDNPLIIEDKDIVVRPVTACAFLSLSQSLPDPSQNCVFRRLES